MQDIETDLDSCKRVGVEEHLRKLNTPPNFKNMKKCISSRFTSSMGSPIPEAVGTPDPPPLITNGRIEMVKPEVQPPLPLDPPPPDVILSVQIKKELEDTDYQNNIHVSPRQEVPEAEVNGEQVNNQSGEICRDFIRGNCKREGTCKFAHRHDLSQLEGVYTFCRKFQNSVCSFKNCKYVHASVFEEQNFYRTGILPPHALAHHKVNMLQPPPPPPPEEPAVVPFSIDFSNPPPSLRNESKPLTKMSRNKKFVPLKLIESMKRLEKPIISCVAASSLEARNFMDDMHLAIPSRSTSPLKREWSNIDGFAAPPCDNAYNEQLAKKCKNCNIMEFRLQYYEDKVNKMLQSKEDLNKKMSLLEKKSEKLYTVILGLRKPTISPKAQTYTNGAGGDKDKTFLEQLNTLWNVHNRLSTLGEDK